MIYENGALKQILIDDGYVTFSGTTPNYGARHYDPCIMRFTTMDPMCEKYYHLSPYAYCGNNPVNYVDPNGKEDYEINKDGYVVNITSVWDMIKTFFGYGNGKDRIFMKGCEEPILSLPEGTITNLKDKKGYTNSGDINVILLSDIDDLSNFGSIFERFIHPLGNSKLFNYMKYPHNLYIGEGENTWPTYELFYDPTYIIYSYVNGIFSQPHMTKNPNLEITIDRTDSN